MQTIIIEDFITLVNVKEATPSILQRNVKLDLNPDTLGSMDVNHYIVLDNDFPGKQMLLMDFLLLEGKSRTIDYSVILPEINYNINYTVFLNNSHLMNMSIKQLQNRNILYLCDGKTNKGEFLWMIFEDQTVPLGSPSKLSTNMIEYIKTAKLKAFERYIYLTF